jgi:indole-3-acetate monooxygenase
MVQTLSPTYAAPPHAATDIPALVRAAVERDRDEADVLRRLPPALLEDLRAAGAFRLYTPRELGGFELGLAETLTVLEEIARLDGPVAWNVWNGNMGFSAALLPEAGVDRIWGDGPDPVIANSARPTGGAVEVDGGFALSGRWDIVSAVDSADWVALFGMVAGEGAPRVFFVRRSDVTVLDTWDVTGMRGTGSGSVVIDTADAVLVPSELAVSPFAPPRIDRALYRVPAFTLASTGCAAAVLGIAAAAVDEVVALAPAKGTDNGVLAGRGYAQAAVAGAASSLRAARLLLRATAADVDAAAAEGAVALTDRAALRAAMCHAATVAREVLTAMYALGSLSSLYRGNRLERLFRDGFAAAQHGLLSPGHAESAGRVMLGQDVGTPVF